MPKRSKHNLGYYNLLTLDLGQLVPIGITEALPADTIQHHVDVLIRLSPLAAPVMHPMTARVHHFFVPHRLVWDGWEDFITGGADGMNEDSPPTILTTNNEKDLLDYFGLVQFPGLEVSALPIRAFNLIYNEYYRDQDLVPERDPEDLTIPFVSWEKDYFTTARPWTQKGEDVTIPMGELAPVVGLAHNTQAEAGNLTTTDEGATVDGADYRGVFSQVGDYPRVYADLAETVGANINDVRRAFAVQRYQEARARYGSRYVEYLRYLGARPLDERLQRPEFLGGGKSQVAISEVMQTAPELQAENEREFGVGDMYGHGIAAMRSNKYRRTINEHGYVISMLSVRPKAMYQAAVERHWLRKDKEDFFSEGTAAHRPAGNIQRRGIRRSL